MNPKGHDQLPNDDQGELFRIETVGSGSTDPSNHSVTHHFEVKPEGFFQEVVQPGQPDELAKHNVTHEDRHNAQLGKHSALINDGIYSSGLRIGAYLPDFGPVTDTNYNEAKTHAAWLDRKRSPVGMPAPASLRAMLATQVEKPAPVAAEPEPVVEHQLSDRELKSWSKVEAIHHEAGFLPTTHREKDEAHRFLAMKDPEAYQLTHEALRSKIYEIGDYYGDALQAETILSTVYKRLQQHERRDATLGSIFGKEHPVYGLLAQHRDLEQFHQTGKMPAGFDSLRTKEDRTPQHLPHKNKIVHSVYEGDVSAAIENRIAGTIPMLDVRAAATLAAEAYNDQHLRAAFWEERLNGIHGPLADEIVAPVLASHRRVE